MSDAGLFPRPRHVEVRGGTAPPDAPVAELRRASLPEQGFELEIGPDGVRIDHADDAGLRYARALLEQIGARSSPLPAMLVRDHPDFAVRGYMLDVSRDRVPTRETLARIVDLLSLARINQLQLYTEHTFAYRDHEAVWRDASPVTPDDIAWLDGLCAGRGIELVANQNCFGHMNRWLIHDAYRGRAECPDGSRSPWGGELPPWTLEPTPDNADFVLRLLDELLPNFSSRRVNIGCDEPFDLGSGRSAAEIAGRGKTQVYLEHLDRIARPLTERGYEVLVWGDVLRDDPELAQAMLPDGVVAVPWHYEQPWPDDLLAAIPPATLETLTRLEQDPTAGFRPQLERLSGVAMPLWIAPGTSSWNSLVGRTDNARGNLHDAAVTGREFGAGGYLVTDWGDNGHHQPPSVSFGPILYGGAVSWCRAANEDMDLPAVLDALVFQDDSGQLGSRVDALGGIWRSTGRLAFNGSPVFGALVGRTTMAFGQADPAACMDTVELIDEAIDAIGRASPRCADASVLRAELRAAARLARHGVWRLLRKAGADAPDDAAMREDLAAAIGEQREAWLARSRPGGLSDSLARLERTLSEYA